MFDIATIITLIAPAVVAPLGCVIVVRAIERAEATRRRARPPAPAILLDSSPAASVSAERARHVA
jgi:hypothetical protein